MDPLNWKRALLFAAAGLAVGFGAANLVEVTGWFPLAAPILCAAAAGMVAFTLRRCEVLNCLTETAFFTYASFIGMGIVRTHHNYLIQTIANEPQTPTALLLGVNLVTFLVAIPFTLAVLFVVALPVWSLAQISKQTLMERDERFWEFVDDQTRR